MLKLFDRNHVYVGPLYSYKKLCIESKLDAKGDKTMSFTLLDPGIDIENESIIETKDDEWVVKESPKQMTGSRKIVCTLNLDGLKIKPFDVFALNDMTIDAMARKALAGTGWTVGHCDVTKVRNFGVVKMSPLQVLQNLSTAFMCDVSFDTKRKEVNFYSEQGSDRGVRFMEDLNLRKLSKESTSYDFYTRIVPKGKNGLTIEDVNDGVEYLDNHQYSDKVITYLWDDDNYTDPNALKEDAEAKLEDLSKPQTSYSVDVIDLAKTGKDGRPASVYADMLFSLGDTVTIVSRSAMIKEKQRVVSITEYPESPWDNKCELSNTTLTFEEMQRRYSDAMAMVEYSIDGLGSYKGSFSGEISVSQILHWETASSIPGFGLAVAGALGGGSVGELVINELTVDDLTVTKSLTLDGVEMTGGTAKFDSVSVKYGEVEFIVGEQLAYSRGIIDKLESTYADIKLAKIEVADVGTLFAKVGLIDRATISEGHITGYLDAVEVNADKITAGTLLADRLILKFTDEDGVEHYRLLESKDGETITYTTLNGDVITDRTIRADHIVARSITSNELAVERITSSNGYIDLHNTDINLGNKLIFENGQFRLVLDNIGSKNLIRESETLNFQSYGFTGTRKEAVYIDENGNVLTDENGNILTE